MAESHIIDLNPNDELRDVIRKMNRNMRTITYANATRIKHIGKLPVDQLQAEIDRVDQALIAAIERFDDEIADLRTHLTPPVGTVMICPDDPSLTYTGTTWARMAEGMSFLTSGSTYTEGTEWARGSDSLTAGAQYIAVAAWKRTA